ncbi:MAG: HIT domain-containing protein [Candidatus Andersenbacteria bacterium]
MEETNTAASSPCIFCNIAAGTTPAEIVFDGGDTLFFHDISPKARVHVIGIPKQHVESLGKIRADHHSMIGKLLHDLAHVAKDLGVDEGGYRVVTNVGADAGQEVEHLHFHLLAGEPLGPLNAGRAG